MKRVLLISNAYYPSTFAGSHRAAKFAKYLPKFGWTPVVLTVDWTPENSEGHYDPIMAKRADGCEVVRVPWQATRRRTPARVLEHASFFLWPYQTPIRLTRDMTAAAEGLLAKQAFDAVWSTYMSAFAHWVADRVTRRHGIPWVADFRDLPDQVCLNWKHRRIVKAEVRTCASAAALTATCQPQVDKLRSRHAAPAYVIPNGFDPDDYPLAPTARSDKFTIRYFGILYSFRDPRPLFAALDLLEARGEIEPTDVEVRFYGADAATVQSLREGFQCSRLVECCDGVPLEEMYRLQQQSVVLLILKSPEAGGSVPSKLFEYMAAARPILNVPGDGDVVDAILAETQAGLSAGNPEMIAGMLKKWYDEWKRTGWVASAALPDRVARYSRQVQAGQLADLLNSVCAERR
jgi:glycosyltransferase involved in cell wall biosynthesis